MLGKVARLLIKEASDVQRLTQVLAGPSGGVPGPIADLAKSGVLYSRRREGVDFAEFEVFPLRGGSSHSGGSPNN
jgi:hypothetical protein